MQHRKHKTSTLKLLGFLLGTAAFLNGCGVLQSVGLLPKPPKTPEVEIPLSQIPYQLALTVKGQADLNLNSKARPSPIRLRLFLTEPDEDLGSQPFETLFEFGGASAPVKPAAIVVLTPDTTKEITLNGKMNQDQLVIAAAFHDLYSSNWIVTKTINTQNPGTITVNVQANSVEIQP